MPISMCDAEQDFQNNVAHRADPLHLYTMKTGIISNLPRSLFSFIAPV